ncbi:MAG: DNA gyrase subunit A [Oscillospiraceae bacterium]|jgi:DNA gyrase subunit A|nr:DNA gyrase subunit A [Oscillospiraceae bacterium]
MSQNEETTFNLDGTKIVNVDIEQQMRESFLEYSMSVIVQRALPDVRDGLKPVHRRIIYKMHEMSLTPDKAYRKCADIVGNVLGSYHPHGDASVYDALVRMAQDFSLRYTLVDGHGNFGSVDGDPPAAYRYTEARMSRLSLLTVGDIDTDTVDMQPNYDDRLLEPVVLPVRFPNLLVNGSTGIAVGMATNIPPHNMNEVIDAVCRLIDKPDADLQELMEYVKGPDFPTGGIIMGKSGIKSAYATGRGKITLRSRAETEEAKNGRRRIVVKEIPYMVNKARLQENIGELVNNKRIEGISAVRDESSSRIGMRVVIELKKDANAQVILNQLYQLTQMQVSVGVIMLALKDGLHPRVMTLIEILKNYLDFQKEIVTRRTRHLLKKAMERAHIVEALKIASDFIDEVINIIRSSKNIPESKERLTERFEFDDLQASAIVAMRLGQLSGLERRKIEGELEELGGKIAEYESILGNEDKILEIVRAELLEIKKKFGDERKTELQSMSGEVDIEALIPVEDCVVTYTHYGYVKRQPADVYHTQRRGGRGVSGMTRRDEDFVQELFVSSSHDYILFFTNRGRMYRIKCYEIPDSSRAARGMNIANILSLDEGEKVEAMICVSDFDESRFVTLVTEKGLIKRTHLSEFRNVKNNGVIAILLNEGDSLAFVRMTSGGDELIVATRNGMAIRFREDEIRASGRFSHGIKAISLSGEDYVIGIAKIRENSKILTITESGQGRRTELSEYRLQSRGGKGIINYKISRGYVCGVKSVADDDEVILISNSGIIIRIAVEDIPVHSRYSGGVKTMRLDEGNSVVTFARAPKDDSGGEEEAPEETDGEEEAPKETGELEESEE